MQFRNYKPLNQRDSSPLLAAALRSIKIILNEDEQSEEKKDGKVGTYKQNRPCACR